MRKWISVLFAMIVTSCSVSSSVANDGSDWPCFRGMLSRGVAAGHRTAEVWDATDPSDEAILWSVDIPGLGHSSPVIYGDRLFITTAVATTVDVPLQVGQDGNTEAADDNGRQQWLVLCYEKSTGAELWRVVAHEGAPKTTRHPKATHANASVAVDQDRVVACFGAEGCYCYDLDGNLLWSRDLGAVNISKYGIGWGYASSPAIRGRFVVLVCDDPADPFLIALNLSDGAEQWRTSRAGSSERSWGTPLIYGNDDSAQVVVNGWPRIASYDLATGDERWRIESGGDNPTPTPFAVDDRFFITNSHGGKSPIYVISADAKGDLSDPDSEAAASVIWKSDKGGCYLSTPVVWKGYLYLAGPGGIIRCFESLTGNKVYEQRLTSRASVTASLVASDDKIYIPSEEGAIYVVQAGPEFEVLAANPMGQPCFATPAISDGVLFVRTTKQLFAIRDLRPVHDMVSEPDE